MTLGVAAAAALVLLVPASPAAAAFAPKLVVTPASAPGGTAVELRATADDDLIARTALYVPLGWKTGTPAPGQLIGSAAGTALAADGSTVLLAGRVTGATADATSGACVSGGSTVWLLQVSAGATQLSIPLVVGSVSGDATGFATATITACWPAPGSPATAGLRLTGLAFELGSNALAPPPAPGASRWRALITPFAPGSATESTAASVEAQSTLQLPTTLTLAARLAVRRTPTTVKVTRTIGGKTVTASERRVIVTRFADLSGQLLGRDPAAATAGPVIELLGGTKPTPLTSLARATPATGGSYTLRIQLDTAAKTVTFAARAALPLRDLGAGSCTPSFGTAVPCVSATTPALTLASALVALATGR